MAKVRMHAGRPRIAFSTNLERIRVAGEWFDSEQVPSLNQDQQKQYSTAYDLVRSLPGWPLVDGINMGQGGFVPMEHQLTPMDIFANPWLPQITFGESKGLERTRLIVADEGGTGKTLSASLLVRYLTVKHPNSGPVVILAPPLLLDHWHEHLLAVFHDEPNRVVVLNSASHYSSHHENRIVICSKWSWAHHLRSIKGHIQDHPPLCVVIDEAHQGRTGALDGDEEQFTDETNVGNTGYDEEIHLSSKTIQNPSVLRSAIRCTTMNAKYAVGVTATPINLSVSEMDTILSDLHAEGYTGDTMDEHSDSEYSKIHGSLVSRARQGFDAHLSYKDFFSELVDLNLIPSQWSRFTIDDDSVSKQLRELLSSEAELDASQALRLLRDLHPYGRHLSITLRDDLTKVEHFRTRHTEVRTITKSTELVQFHEALLHKSKQEDEFESVFGELTSLKRQAMLTLSHCMNPWRQNPQNENKPFYSGTYHLPQGHQRPVSLADPRLHDLLNHIRNESESVDCEGKVRDRAIGCVIFTEWKGTANRAGLPSTIKLQTKENPDWDGPDISVEVISAGLGLDELKNIMKKCRRKSLQEGVYPILISTPAGEVGIEMEWATNLVHWDMHTNPQRMEQRTWRLDRRIREGSKTSSEYKILFYRYSNDTVAELQKKTYIEPRWKTSCSQLGIGHHEYVANQVHNLIPAQTSVALWDDEIRRFQALLVTHDAEGEQKSYAQNRHRWLAYLGLTLCGFEVPKDSMLNEGVFLREYEPSTSVRLSPQQSLIRDVESLSPGAARALRFRINEPANAPRTSHLSHSDDASSLPLFNGLLHQYPIECEGQPCFVYTGTQIAALAVNRELLNLHFLERIEDTGLRFLVDDEWLAWSDIENDEMRKETTGGDLLEVLRMIWASEEQNLDTAPVQAPDFDSPALTSRLSVLSQHVNEMEQRINRHKQRLEGEKCTDEDSEWRPDAIKALEKQIGLQSPRINTMEDVQIDSTFTIIAQRVEDS
jgi:hypothetical protein